MTLGMRSKIWTLVILFLVIANALVGILTLRELRKMSVITAQDHQVTAAAWQIKGDLARYLAFGLTAQITRGASDIEERNRARQELFKHSRTTLRPSLNPELRQAILNLRQHIERLLLVTHESQNAFVSPIFRQFFFETRRSADRLIERSSQIVADERTHDSTFYRQFFIVEILLSLITIMVVAGRLFATYKEILLPVQSLHDLVLAHRRGDLSARWHGDQSNEIGLIGQTINDIVDDIQKSQRERIQFIGAVVHDLKNPLAAISMNCDLVLRHKNELTTEVAFNTIGRIKVQSDRLKRLAEDLLQTTTNERMTWELKIASINIEQLARDTVELFTASQIEHSYSLVVTQPVPEIQGDRDRIAQVMINLISNATKYSQAGSNIMVIVGGGEEQVLFEVHDQGLGIPNEKKGIIFEPFTRLDTTKDMAEGTGLGLAIAKEVVHAHGGSISVLDREGGGSVFRVLLPRFQSHRRSAA